MGESHPRGLFRKPPKFTQGEASKLLILLEFVVNVWSPT